MLLLKSPSCFFGRKIGRKWKLLLVLVFCMDFAHEVKGSTGTRREKTVDLPVTPRRSTSRVIDGEDAAENAWPWFALIVKKSSTLKQSLREENLFGGGSIINNHWILTAAHLFKIKTRSDLIVFVGLSERPSRREHVKHKVKAYLIEKYIKHPNYNPSGWNNDIALIKLGSRINNKMRKVSGRTNILTYRSNIQAISLCSNRVNCRVESGDIVTVIGFGHTESVRADESHRPSKKLQEARIRIEDVARCRHASPEFTDNMLCCVPSSGSATQDACQGDSGGPLMKRVHTVGEHGTPEWVQIGIVSFGEGCGSQYPGYYTEVSKYTTWIIGAMANIHYFLAEAMVDMESLGWYEASNGYLYKYFAFRKTWMRANATCHQHGAILASKGVRDTRVRSELFDRLNGFAFWIGLTDIDREGRWIWEDGIQSDGTDLVWARNAPRNDLAPQDCAIQYNVRGEYQANDHTCNGDLLSYICEKSP